MHESFLTFRLTVWGLSTGKMAGGMQGRAGPEWRTVYLSECNFTLQTTHLTEKIDLITGLLTTELVK